ncbi:Rhodopsin, GQ-coupled [Armadillidium vulgare]|nr:Rhodopsin, GQ-coupled [Armadillidium vulgare]
MDSRLLYNNSEYLQSNSTKYLESDDETLQLDDATADIDQINESPTGTRRHLPIHYQFIITFFYIFGIVGNCAALRIISKNETKRFQKQALMLKCLASNDLLALLGSFLLMYVKLYMPSADAKVLCATRVVCRAFGLGSGCVATVMALDRWLALSHPFTYQKHITQTFVKSFIYGLWILNVILVCAPFVGFGLWFDESRFQKPCIRYRYGTTILDRTYAHVVFMFDIYTSCSEENNLEEKNSRANTTTRNSISGKEQQTTPKTLVTNESIASTNGMLRVMDPSQIVIKNSHSKKTMNTSFTTIINMLCVEGGQIARNL